VKVSFWGVRGSTPVSGAEFVRYGGSTSCVSVARDGDELPRLVLDAGTGLRNLARQLGSEPFRGTIALSHMHWDHTQGLPFFRPADHDAATVDLRLPVDPDGDLDAEQVLSGVMQPPFFPIGPRDLGGTWTFGDVECGRAWSVDGLSVVAHDVPHKGGRAVGYRVTDGTSTMAYVPDHRPTAFGGGDDGFGAYHPAAIALAADADVLVHGAPFLAAELELADRYGHTTLPYAVGLAERAGVRQLVVTHHSPARSDDQLDEIAERAAASSSVAVVFAREEMTVSTRPS